MRPQAAQALEGAASAGDTLQAGFTTVTDIENEGSGYADVALRVSAIRIVSAVTGARRKISSPTAAAIAFTTAPNPAPTGDSGSAMSSAAHRICAGASRIVGGLLL